MSATNRILCPLDLSQNSLEAVGLATAIAKEKNAKIVFIYVAPHWIPEGVYFTEEFIRDVTEHEQEEFEKIRPTDEAVEFEHIFMKGNAGPEIVKQSKTCDMVVMSTHGYGAIMRMIMGSVANYTMRHANCPVVLYRTPQDATANNDQVERVHRRFTTEVMRPAHPVQCQDEMDTVLAELDRARETAAPVINESGECIGILTKTDLDRYREMLDRYEAKDESVISEMFVVNKYGQRRSRNHDFSKVQRHMSSPVITISNTETIEKALQMFAEDQTIHHLVVVDEQQHALGVIQPSDCRKQLTLDVPAEPN